MKILNTLTLKHLKMNKRRTIVTIVGVILSCALMMGVGIIFSSVYHNIIESVKKYNGPQEVSINNIKHDELNIVTQNVNVDTVLYEQLLTYGKSEQVLPEDTKPYVVVKNANDYYFHHLTIANGRKPKNDQEIILPTYYNTLLETSYKIGDKITITEGKRIVEGETITDENVAVGDLETFEETGEKTYTIVGFYEKNIFEEYSSPAYSFFTKTDVEKHDNIKTYIVYKKHDKISAKTEKIATELKKTKSNGDYEDVQYNQALLSIYGQSKYENYNTMLTGVVMIMLALISVACIIVIYNSFNISVMERKKQFGLFSSIGATAKQLRYSVFYEAGIIALIGMPLGILGGYIGIDVVIRTINALLPDMMNPKLILVIYPSFVIIPLFFMIAVIFISAYLPARRASKVTPIEAIRQNDDIKLKGKKVKTNRLMRKLFGVEGDIALKNIKRNKKKYRITVVSLFISIVLFVSFSGILKYGLYGSEAMLEATEYDASVRMSSQSSDKVADIAKRLRNISGVEKSLFATSDNMEIPKLKKEDYNKDYYRIFSKSIEELKDNTYSFVVMYKFADEDYEAYKKQIGLTEDRPILIHQAKQTYQDEKGNRKTYTGSILNTDRFKNMMIYFDASNVSDPKGMEIKDIYETDQFPFGLESSALYGQISIVIPHNLYDEIMNKYNQTFQSYDRSTYYMMYFKTSDAKQLEKAVNTMKKESEVNNIQYYNVVEAQKLQRNMILVIKILLYGFIGLVTLIGITSVFNTISTSLALRKKEFAMLRSIGLTPKGFQKILWFESMFFVLKALLYSLPVSFVVIWFVHQSMGQGLDIPGMLIPWEAVMIAVIFSFIIVLMTTIYSTRKMRHENILEAIREENI